MVSVDKVMILAEERHIPWGRERRESDPAVRRGAEAENGVAKATALLHPSMDRGTECAWRRPHDGSPNGPGVVLEEMRWGVGGDGKGWKRVGATMRILEADKAVIGINEGDSDGEGLAGVRVERGQRDGRCSLLREGEAERKDAWINEDGPEPCVEATAVQDVFISVDELEESERADVPEGLGVNQRSFVSEGRVLHPALEDGFEST